MWTKAFAAVLLAAVVAVVLAGRDTPVRRAVVGEEMSETERALAKPLTDFELQEVPFEEAIDRLRQRCRVAIRIDRMALNTVGIELRSPVSAPAMRKGTLTGVLEMLLEQVGAGAHPLGFLAHDDHIVISTSEVLNRKKVVRVYHIADLVGKKLPPSNVPTGPGDPWHEQFWLTVMNAIKWEGMHTPGATVQILGDRMVVTMTKENHVRLQDLLDQLRQPPPPLPPRPMLAGREWSQTLQRWVWRDAPDPELVLFDPVDEVTITTDSLGGAIEAVARAAGGPVYLDAHAFGPARGGGLFGDEPPSPPAPDDDSFDPKQPVAVNLRTRGETLARVLDRLFAAFEAAGAPALEYVVRESSIVVTKREHAENQEVARIYDVRDLLPQNPATSPAGVGGSAHAAAVKKLLATVEAGAAPGSWRTKDGLLYRLAETDGHLVVTQSLRNHEQVARVLAGLRGGGEHPRTQPAATSAPAAGQRIRGGSRE